MTEAHYLLEMEAQGFAQPAGIENQRSRVEFFGSDLESAAKGCDTLVLLTEWDQYQKQDYKQIATIMRKSLGEHD